jgi:transcription initiation factor TFIIIB Brf1 subunit/transcription initiation factor TFIIB
MEHPPVCPNCEATLDLSPRNVIQPLVYANVACPKCGTLCVLEGPEENVGYARRRSA